MDKAPTAAQPAAPLPAVDRRRFLRLAGGAALVPATMAAIAACGGDDRGSSSAAAAASPTSKKVAPAMRKLTLGFIALTDCAPLVMAKELGFYADRGLDVTLEKQASWPATRDNLLTGGIDGAHCLNWMPYSVASGVSGSSRDLKIAMMLNNNGQAITLAKDLVAAGYGDLAAAREVLDAKPRTLAMTYPGGTHDLWLRYWLRATGADESKAKVIPIPPPQMVANMKINTMDAFCVGEPWNAVAVAQGIGFTHLTTQDLWRNHPEKALVVNAKLAADKDVLHQLILGTLEACKWLDDLGNRAKAATTIGAPGYVNAPAKEITARLLGTYDLGAGLGTKTYKGNQMMFHRGGATNAPLWSYGIWGLAQYQRFGYLAEAPPYRELAEALVLKDDYEKAAAEFGIDVPEDMQPIDILLDEHTFDPNDPKAEAART